MKRRGPLGYERPGTPKATRSPSVLDLHWAAGLLEGEANFLGFGGQRGTGGTHRVTVEQTECPEILERLQSLFGGSISDRSRRNQREKWGHKNARDNQVWRVCGSRARGLMLTMYSLLSAKRKAQIDVALGGLP